MFFWYAAGFDLSPADSGAAGLILKFLFKFSFENSL